MIEIFWKSISAKKRLIRFGSSFSRKCPTSEGARRKKRKKQSFGVRKENGRKMVIRNKRTRKQRLLSKFGKF